MWTKTALLIAIMALAMPVLGQNVPIPTVPADLGERLTNAANDVGELPDQIQDDVPLPDSPDPQVLFGYVRWLFSFEVAQELLGARLAWAGLALFHILMVIIPLMTVYMVISAVTTTIKFLKWLVSLFIKLIELIPVFQ